MRLPDPSEDPCCRPTRSAAALGRHRVGLHAWVKQVADRLSPILSLLLFLGRLLWKGEHLLGKGRKRNEDDTKKFLAKYRKTWLTLGRTAKQRTERLSQIYQHWPTLAWGSRDAGKGARGCLPSPIYFLQHLFPFCIVLTRENTPHRNLSQSFSTSPTLPPTPDPLPCTGQWLSTQPQGDHWATEEPQQPF